jgi:hypothetical protein
MWILLVSILYAGQPQKDVQFTSKFSTEKQCYHWLNKIKSSQLMVMGATIETECRRVNGAE